MESPPPPPGSILTLTIVTLGALAAHILGALFFWLQELACGWIACHVTRFDPNIYAAFFDITANKGRVTGLEALEMFAALGLITAFSFFGARAIIARLAGKTGLLGLLYGWLSELAVALEADQAVLAYVLSDVEDSGVVVGYEGVVANMTANADREITSILLTSCETFYLHISASGVVRREGARDQDIPQLYLDRSRIKNIAFERVRFGDLSPERLATR